jgi:hypothetical protein
MYVHNTYDLKNTTRRQQWMKMDRMGQMDRTRRMDIDGHQTKADECWMKVDGRWMEVNGRQMEADRCQMELWWMATNNDIDGIAMADDEWQCWQNYDEWQQGQTTTTLDNICDGKR